MDSLVLLWSTHLLAPRSYCEFFRRLGNGLPVDWEPRHNSERATYSIRWILLRLSVGLFEALLPYQSGRNGYPPCRKSYTISACSWRPLCQTVM